MTSIRIIDVATANPPLKLSQEDILQRILKADCRSRKEKKLYQHFLSEPSIESRYIGIDKEPESLFSETQDEAILRFQDHATRIGTEAVKKLLDQTGLRPDDIDGIVIATCTGYLCPGLTSYISQAVGLREDIHAVDLVGIGCGAALPAMKSAWQYLNAHENSNVIVLAVEICTATSYWTDNVDLIISNSIFGDGAAACLMSNQQGRAGLEIKTFKSVLWPQYRDELRYITKNGRLHNVLKKEVPHLAAKAFQQVLTSLKQDHDFNIAHFAVHPGGRKILDEIDSACQLDRHALDRSREVLRKYGNMSSPSVLYVLRDIINKDNLRPDDIVGIFAFGAGLTAFGAITQWKEPSHVQCV